MQNVKSYLGSGSRRSLPLRRLSKAVLPGLRGVLQAQELEPRVGHVVIDDPLRDTTLAEAGDGHQGLSLAGDVFDECLDVHPREFRVLNPFRQAPYTAYGLPFRPMATLAERVIEVLRDSKLKPVALAKIAGCSKGLVTQWKDGTAKKMSPVHAENIEQQTGYSRDWLMWGRLPKRIDLAVRRVNSAMMGMTPEQRAQIARMVESFKG